MLEKNYGQDYIARATNALVLRYEIAVHVARVLHCPRSSVWKQSVNSSWPRCMFIVSVQPLDELCQSCC